MRWARCLPYFLIVLLLFLVAAFFREPRLLFRSGLVASISQPPPPRLVNAASPDQQAYALVAQAIDNVRKQDRSLLRTAIRFRSHVSALSYRGEGVYYQAADSRFRLDVKLRRDSGQMDSGLIAVGDGRHRWEAIKDSSGRLHQVQRSKQGESGPTASIQPGALACGPQSLLSNLSKHIVWVGAQVEGNHRYVHGTWPLVSRPKLVPPGQPWPADLPRCCRLRLDGPDCWPGRLEWWGPHRDGGEDTLLLELEYARPDQKVPLSEEEKMRLFTFEPGTAKVLDLTAPR